MAPSDVRISLTAIANRFAEPRERNGYVKSEGQNLPPSVSKGLPVFEEWDREPSGGADIWRAITEFPGIGASPIQQIFRAAP
jgi:hypothetical protein